MPVIESRVCPAPCHSIQVTPPTHPVVAPRLHHHPGCSHGLATDDALPGEAGLLCPMPSRFYVCRVVLAAQMTAFTEKNFSILYHSREEFFYIPVIQNYLCLKKDLVGAILRHTSSSIDKQPNHFLCGENKQRVCTFMPLHVNAVYQQRPKDPFLRRSRLHAARPVHNSFFTERVLRLYALVCPVGDSKQDLSRATDNI